MKNTQQEGIIIVKKYLLLLMLFSIFSLQANAYTTFGTGTLSCQIWLAGVEDFKKGNVRPFVTRLTWVDGFVSASGWYGTTMKEVDNDDMTAIVSHYCKENPAAQISDAAKALVKKLEIK